jgi:hypothetical protein
MEANEVVRQRKEKRAREEQKKQAKQRDKSRYSKK